MTKKLRRFEPIFDLVTVVMVFASVGVLGITFLIISDPQVSFNPLPPPTLPSIKAVPSATLTPTATLTLTPSNTPNPTLTFTPSITPTPTLTFTPSATPSLTPSPTNSPTPVLLGLPTNTPGAATAIPTELPPTSVSVQAPSDFSPVSTYPFSASGPTYQRNLGERSCEWASIGGNVNGLFGEPLINVAVEITGEQFTQVEYSGNAPAFGQSGFEIQIGNQPRRGLFAVRLLGSTGEPISDYFYVDTVDACDSNVAIIEFIQNREY